MYRYFDLAGLLGDDSRRVEAARWAKQWSPPVAVTSLVGAALVIVAFVLIFVYGSQLENVWLKFLIGATFSTYIASSAFTLAHEAAHNNLVRGHRSLRWVNDAVGWLLGFIYLRSYPAFREVHRAHHQFLNDGDKDPDFWLIEYSGWRQFLRVFFAVLMTRIETERFARKIKRPDIVHFDNLHWLIVIALIALAIWRFSLVDVIAFWLAPATFAAWVSAALSGILPHARSGPAPREHDISFRLLPSGLQPIGTFLANGHNYHHVHHAFPTTPFYNYAPLARRLIAMGETAGIKSAAERPPLLGARATDGN